MSIDKEIYKYSTGKILKPNSVVIDIGAYHGTTAINICSQSNGDPKRYHLIEACPENYRCLLKNVEKHGFNTYNLAMGDAVKKVNFYTASSPRTAIGSSQSNSLYKGFIERADWCTQANCLDVEMEDVDHFLGSRGISYVDFMKINCEGGEYQIFKAKTDFLSIVGCLYLQMHGHYEGFLGPDIKAMKELIIKRVLDAGFELVMGDELEEAIASNKHTHQLFTK